MEAWYTTALDIEEVLAGAVDAHVHVFVADVVKSFDAVDGGFWTVCLAVRACLPGFVMRISNIVPHVRPRFKLAAGLCEPWTRDGRHSPRLSFEYDVHCCSLPSLVLGAQFGWCLSHSFMLIIFSVYL